MASLQNVHGASALHGIAAASSPPPQGSRGAVVMRDTGLLDKINLRCDAGNTVINEALSRVVGTRLPAEPNRFHVSGNRRIAWLGPDEWIILAENGSADTIIAGLDLPEAGHVAVNNVSDALGSIILEGEHTRDALAKHCALDFHPTVFTPGIVQQSLLSHAGVTIMCLDDNAFQIIGRCSFMPYIVALLKDAMIEYGYEFQPA